MPDADDAAERRLTRADFAAEAGTTTGVVDRLVEAGALQPDHDGRFPARDEVIASTAQALVDAGIALEDLVGTLANRQFGIRSLGRFFSEPAPRTAAPYAAVVAGLGSRADHLPAVYAALGLPEPEPDDHPRADEAELVAEFVRLWSLVDPTGEAHVRVARLIGDSTRRMAEGWLDVWGEIAKPDPTTQGAPTVGPAGRPADPTDPEQNPSIGMAGLARRLVSLVHERHVEATLNTRILTALEGVLGAAGRIPSRPVKPPAIAFVDLSGFTSLTEAEGDEAAARAATRLQALAEAAVRSEGGRVVKQLGDGVLLRLPTTDGAIRAVREILKAAQAVGLPPPHAGIAAGPVIMRDGDVFGRTVNLAARLAARADSGDTLVEEGVVVALPPGTARFEPLGRLELPGFGEPVAAWRVRPGDDPQPD